MRLIIRAFILPKKGSTIEECDDKFYPKYLNGQGDAYELSDQRLTALGIADGATEGLLSGAWADILVKAFCRSNNDRPNINLIVEKALKNWELWMKNYLVERGRHNKPIQWYEEPGLKKGSFSTLLGLVFSNNEESDGGEWQALAIGDSCLFLIRDENLVQSFPIEDSSSFGNCPALISSNPMRNRDLTESGKIYSGKWCSNDNFYLMTDALACWFLQESEAGKLPWLSYPFAEINKELTFESWVDKLRSTNEMKNDDVTLIHIEVSK